MLRGPRALAPATAQPTKGVPALSPTELWPSDLSSPQLCPATTTTYYTSLYPQTVPTAVAPGTCLDATPHRPEAQVVRSMPPGRLPVMLGSPAASPLLFRVGERSEGRLRLMSVAAARVLGRKMSFQVPEQSIAPRIRFQMK
jgi:hypothetical protein